MVGLSFRNQDWSDTLIIRDNCNTLRRFIKEQHEGDVLWLCSGREVTKNMGYISKSILSKPTHFRLINLTMRLHYFGAHVVWRL